MRVHLSGTVALCLLAASGAGAVEPCPAERAEGAAQAVDGYLTAMQEHRFEDAYDFVTAGMTDGKSRGAWAALQKMFYEGGEVNIYGIDIRTALAPEDDSACAEAAIVPNVLKSRDKFNNQGLTEFELYTVVDKDDRWLIDRQRTLFEQPEVDRWFPGEQLPEFRDQY